MAGPAQETFFQKVSRSCSNCFASCMGLVQKSDELAKIEFKKQQLASRKKTFGVEYMDLKDSGATNEELEACVQKCVDDMNKIRAEIEELQKEVERVDAETKAKIKPPPTPVATKTDGAATATPSSPAVVDPKPAPMPVPSAPAVEVASSAQEDSSPAVEVTTPAPA